MTIRAFVASAAATLGLFACVVGVGNFSGKTCDTARDCPEPYVCVSVRPNQGRTCELLRGPEYYDPSGGPPVPFCQVKPVLDRTCISNCHGADHTGAVGQEYFRLDVYEGDGGAEFRLPDGGTVKGAKDMAENIVKRAVVYGNMPPSSPPGLPFPTDAEKALLSRWAAQGAPFMVDGGSCDGG